jgi:hypothetical protein
MELEPFENVLKSIKTNKSRPFHLLTGNGLSIAYDSKIFSYSALYDFVQKAEDEQIISLFKLLNTTNFEQLMHELDTLSALVDIFGPEKVLKEIINSATTYLKASLIQAVKTLHPEHVFTIPQSDTDACKTFLLKFLNTGGCLFTASYDLLLYWVLMRSQINSIDGFGRDRESDDDVPPEEAEYSELRWGRNRESQNTFYLHGALHLFDTGVEIIKEEYDAENYLLDKIKNRMNNGGYPIFVSAGDSEAKLTHIMHNRYLSDCYERLSSLEGSLVTFGFNFSDNDGHIIDAINAAAKYGRKVPKKLWSIYIGVYSKEDQKHIEQLASYLKCKVHIYDAKTAHVWGRS